MDLNNNPLQYENAHMVFSSNIDMLCVFHVRNELTQDMPVELLQ